MPHIILFQPEIPPNTGNVIRLCANTGFTLHLIEPLAFELDDKRLRRAGLDYHEYAEMRTHASLDDCLRDNQIGRVFAFSTRGIGNHCTPNYRENDALLFGPETRGLPDEILDALPAEQRLRIPMRAGCRSLNLSNAVAVAAYEVWRQRDFAGSAG
jgi:tRNA (cytidine/uridine-2'-O-)-methyltransferase